MSNLELTMMRRVGELNKEVANLKAEADRLKAEVERLTKAGDAMAKLLSCCGNPQSEVRGWNAAKEGKLDA
jgi:uncharacterized small protein (DUF1192 family)